MIQRKQTIYLFIAFIAMVLNFIFPVAEFIGSGGHQIEYYIYKVVDLTPGMKLDMDTSFFMASSAFAGLVSVMILASFPVLTLALKMVPRLAPVPKRVLTMCTPRAVLLLPD